MAFGNGCVISLYKPTTTLQPKVLGFVWCTLSHHLFPKARDNQKNTVNIYTVPKYEFLNVVIIGYYRLYKPS